MRKLSLLLVLAPVAIGLAACGDFRAERQGRQVGDAVCDLRDVDDADEAERAIKKLEREMADVARIVGRPIDEDIEDIAENYTDLVEHTLQGNDALQDQDIAVIQRNILAVQHQLDTEGDAAYSGILQGLAACDY
jgi:hypothetical protein